MMLIIVVNALAVAVDGRSFFQHWALQCIFDCDGGDDCPNCKASLRTHEQPRLRPETLGARLCFWARSPDRLVRCVGFMVRGRWTHAGAAP